MADSEKSGNAFVETIKTIVYALVIAGVFRTLRIAPAHKSLAHVAPMLSVC